MSAIDLIGRQSAKQPATAKAALCKRLVVLSVSQFAENRLCQRDVFRQTASIASF
jgi:hypothetical protein